MNCRTSVHKRAQFLWSANGTMIGNLTYPAGLVDANCQGSIVNVGGKLFTSNAASDTGRQNMVVKTSSDQGHTWAAVGPAVWAGPSGYSQLVDMLHSPTSGIGLLFEAGEHHYTETISFVVVPV